MKRVAPVGESSSKRIKLDEDTPFDDPSLEQSPQALFDHGLTNGSGYISCLCFMTWRPTKKHQRAILETKGGASSRSRFEVEIMGACAPFFEEIELKARDEFLLALNGARVEKPENPSRLCSLSMKLVYEEGIRIKFLKRRGTCRTVDTWELKAAAKRDEDAWFLTPQEPNGAEDTRSARAMGPSSSLPTLTTARPPDILTKSPAGTTQLIPLPPTPSAADPEPSKTSLQDETNRQGAMPHSPNPGATVGDPVVKLSKKKKRKLDRIARRAAHRETSEATSLPYVAPPELSSAPMHPHATRPPSTTAQIIPRHVSNAEATSEVREVHRPDSKAAQVETPGFTAGLVTRSGEYHALRNDLNTNVLCNMIGVVVQTSSPRKTRNGEWSCNVKLVDPSNTEVDNLNGSGSFQINCFTKLYEQWLPQPKLGDILILRELKISDYYGSRMGIGYNDRLQWAIYCPTTGKIRHGDLGEAPESEGVAGGYGYKFTPFHQPCQIELGYCLKLADWWLEVQKQRKAIGEVHQVGEGVAPAYTRPQRRHRLISEAGPDVQPSGFFDCTIEVLHGHMNDNGVYSLYVTDYTVNQAITPVQAEWCPTGLADYVLKMEVWDAAVETAQTMFAGEYYSIKNARMMMSHGGYVEGKLVEQKVRKLEVEEDGEVDLIFKALLERKKAWQDASSTDDKPDVFENCTIEEAKENQHFNCVVEVLHSVHDGDGTSCLYVTDYTPRDELLATRAQGDWANGLKGRILKIALFNNQVEMAKSVEAGSFYSIKKVRVKNSTTARQFQGQLGGMERLIFLVNPKSSDDKIGQLKRRKEEWKRSLEAPAKVTKSNLLLESSGTARHRRGKTIAELESDQKCPNKTRISAKIIDFRPRNLSDAVIINCTNCKQDLPPSQKACFKCDDTDHEYVRYMFQMYLLLQDEDGDQIYVSLNDESSVFRDLKRTDIREDIKGLRALSGRLSSMLGSLLEIHDGATPENNRVEPDTPVLSLIIDSWDADGKRAYCLAECENLEV